ncbi:MAG TPA: hydrogenase 4 subunit B [Verrucomicrobiae bacterium]|nr:hydrogenase 4 subunit B [Verrucomicrobiae bacterium]
MSHMLNYLFIGTVFFYCLGALLGVLAQGRDRLAKWLSFLPGLLASCCGLATAIGILSSQKVIKLAWGNLMPGFEYGLRIDMLAAFFLAMICGVGMVGAVYSLGYVKEYFGRKNVGFLGSMYNLFLLSMVMVVSAANTFVFLMVWEVMAIVSYFLVTFEHEKPGVRKAGFIYVVMTHIGTGFLTLGLLILYRVSGSLDFAAFGGLSLSPLQKDLVFILTLVGLGTKAGIVPFHIWLPRAHPAAPSNVSALMSGVMVKTAVYMFLRINLDFLGQGPLWWGLLVILLGFISALIGILYAMVDNDLKRLLAYSTVENIGIIYLAMGVGLLGMSLGLAGLAKLALMGALFHALNHAAFKSLLFMNAGAVVQGTHSKNIEHFGGLIKKMPYTAGLFLIGSLAISAFPPFNGFISEWITFQSLLALGTSSSGWLRIIGPVLAALLGLVAAMAATTFVKAFGFTFLAVPRTPEAERAQETNLPMLAAGSLLALACLALGVFPGVTLQTLDRILPWGPSFTFKGLTQLTVPGALNDISLTAVLVTLAVSAAVAAVIMRAWGGKTALRVDETWNCGVGLNSRMEYSATGFVMPLRLIFKQLISDDRNVASTYTGAKYFIKSMSYSARVKSYFEQLLYRPVKQALLTVSGRIKQLQTGSIHVYLAYILVTLVALLMLAK